MFAQLERSPARTTVELTTRHATFQPSRVLLPAVHRRLGMACQAEQENRRGHPLLYWRVQDTSAIGEFVGQWRGQRVQEYTIRVLGAAET